MIFFEILGAFSRKNPLFSKETGAHKEKWAHYGRRCAPLEIPTKPWENARVGKQKKLGGHFGESPSFSSQIAPDLTFSHVLTFPINSPPLLSLSLPNNSSSLSSCSLAILFH